MQFPDRLKCTLTPCPHIVSLALSKTVFLILDSLQLWQKFLFLLAGSKNLPSVLFVSFLLIVTACFIFLFLSSFEINNCGLLCPSLIARAWRTVRHHRGILPLQAVFFLFIGLLSPFVVNHKCCRVTAGGHTECSDVFRKHYNIMTDRNSDSHFFVTDAKQWDLKLKNSRSVDACVLPSARGPHLLVQLALTEQLCPVALVMSLCPLIRS